MAFYPMIVTTTGLGTAKAGVFSSGTIPDVAQAAGAGYGKSKEAGDVATIVRLLRVAILQPESRLRSFGYAAA